MISPTLTALDASARLLRAGEMDAVFLPQHGMLGASWRVRGMELLGRVEDIVSFAKVGRTSGIPLLYPFANRLAQPHYNAAGKEVTLDVQSHLLGLDNGLLIHGVAWSHLAWEILAENSSSLTARLNWTRDELLAVFPFPHHVEMQVALDENALTITTTIFASAASRVPISFGFHPYFQIPNLPRAEWRVALPEMWHLELDAQHIPTGRETAFDAWDELLGTREFDDGFRLQKNPAAFALGAEGNQITVEFLEGFPYAQVYAPREKNFIAFEPMTAPTNALVSGDELRILEAGENFRAVFRVCWSKE